MTMTMINAMMMIPMSKTKEHHRANTRVERLFTITIYNNKRTYYKLLINKMPC